MNLELRSQLTQRLFAPDCLGCNPRLELRAVLLPRTVQKLERGEKRELIGWISVAR